MVSYYIIIIIVGIEWIETPLTYGCSWKQVMIAVMLIML